MGITNENLYFKPSLRIINDEQISQIHGATLEVLERTGIQMTHARGLEILEELDKMQASWK
jgi:trimethylamine--corrinoid protein Co-methyltransferase